MLESTRTLTLTAIALLAFAACGDDDDGPSNNGNTNNDIPNLTALRTGNLVADGAGGAPDATGSVTISENASGELFVTLGADFMQEIGPGDTQLILAQSGENVAMQRSADPDSTSDSLATVANGFAGAATFALPASITVDAFSHLIVWCPTAGVNFGAAELSGGGDGSDRTVVRTATLMADGAGGAPDATGEVRIERSSDGSLVIVLGDDFTQEMGPGDTQLILARTGDNVQMQRDADASSASMSLGTIPNGASGAREFTVPAGVDLDAFDYVIVWCPTAGVNFGAAQLPLRSGILVADGAGGAPDATGSVMLVRGTANELLVELGADFMQEMGPGDTQLILAKGEGNVAEQRMAEAMNASDSLGTITNGASGMQSFEVPAGVDVDQFDFVIIWCPTAGVNFGVASLN